MVFSSLVFLLGFLPALLLVYFLIPARFRGLRNLVLLGASLFFYWWGASKLVLLMVLSILVNYLAGQQAVVSFDTFEKQAARASAGIVMAMLKNLPDVEEWEGARGD